MKKINKSMQKMFKSFFYLIFSLIHGKIKGVISSNGDSRLQIIKSKFEDSIQYNVYRVKNARLYTDRIHDTAIILDDKIVEGPSHQLRPINNADIKQNIVFTKGTPRIKKKIKGKVLSLLTGGAGNNNYFHWIFDVLPRIKICQQILDINEVDYFLLPDLEKKYQTESLDNLNIPKEKRLSSKYFRHIIADEIIITDHPYCINNDADKEIEKIPKWISLWLKNSIISADSELEKKNYPDKVYIDRSDSISNTKKLRSITNEDIVKDFLKKRGFKILALSIFSFEEQAKIFNKASQIVGLHGAGFANFCFCEPKTIVVELRSNTSGNVCENLAISNNLNYKSISCETVGVNYNNQFGHIKVPIEILEEKIK